MTEARPNLAIELAFLALLAVLWGSSYPFIRIAVAEVTPVTLVAIRVTGAALFLVCVLAATGHRLPRGIMAWRALLVQALFNSILAWTVLAWGQQFISAGLAAVLNSTAPIFVVLFSLVLSFGASFQMGKTAGAALGLVGVILIMGTEVLGELNDGLKGQIACLAGAMLYACGALYGTRFQGQAPVVTAAGTMICASLTLVPAAFILEQPMDLAPSAQAVGAAGVLSFFCTGCAFLVYFRLIKTLGSVGVASQAYLRACIGVALGMIFLGETLAPETAAGVAVAVAGVALINWPRRLKRR